MGSKSKNLKYALCYVPLVSVILFFVEQKKTNKLMKHIKYGIILFSGYIIIHFLLGFLFGKLISLVYLCVTGYFGYKVYYGEDVNIEQIDKLEDKIKDSANNNSNKKL